MKELAKAKQIEIAIEALVTHKGELVATEDWLNTLAYCKCDEEFRKISEPICDAIIFPKCEELFPKEPFKSMKAFLTQMKIPVNAVCQAVKKGCIFI